MFASDDLDIIPKVMAPYTSVDCTVAMYTCLRILALTPESVAITFKAFSFCCALDRAYFACDANVNCLSTITPRCLTSLNHGIGCLLMVKVQLGSANRKYIASVFSGANFEPSVETIIMFNAAEG